MRIFTDDTGFAERALAGAVDWSPLERLPPDPGSHLFLEKVLPGKTIYAAGIDQDTAWDTAFITLNAAVSQYDLLVDFSGGASGLPGRSICLAGSGANFHGQRGRLWKAELGNIHLAAHFSPNQKIEGFGIAFPVLAAVSLIEALDELPGLDGRAGIKWVNDILIQGAKVAGFLVHTSSLRDHVTDVVLGIGLNVEQRPDVPPDPFVPRTAALCDFLANPSSCSRRNVLLRLLARLDANIDLILAGKSSDLLEIYRQRSLILGRNVRIMTDPDHGSPEEIASGRVIGIGSQLELYLQYHRKPVTSGRLILHD